MTVSRIVLTSIMANLSAYDISQMTAAPVWFVRRGVSRKERKVDLTPALSLEEREVTSLACGHPLIPRAPLKGGRGGLTPPAYGYPL